MRIALVTFADISDPATHLLIGTLACRAKARRKTGVNALLLAAIHVLVSQKRRGCAGHAGIHLPHLCSTAGEVLYSSMKSNELSLRWVKVTSLMRTRFPGIVHSSCI